MIARSKVARAALLSSLPLAVLFLGLAIATLAVLPGQFGAALEDALRAKAIALGELAALGVGPALEYDDAGLASEVFAGARRDEDVTYMAVLRDGGATVAKTGSMPRGIDVSAASKQPATSTSTTWQGEWLVVMAPIQVLLSDDGILLAVLSTKRMKERQTLYHTYAAIIALGVAVLGLLASAAVAMNIARVERSRAHVVELLKENELARAKAESANAAKGVFVASISHELRTPLNGVLGMNRLLLESRLTPQQVELARSAQRSGEHLLATINDLLDFSKIEAGKLHFDITDIDVWVAIEDVAELTTIGKPNPALETLCDIAPEVPRIIRTDGLRLRQVLTNLLGNARKFAAEGQVIVRASLVGENVLRFEVEDTGIGITEEQCGRIFEAFTQADSATTRQYGGTGLGLAICRRIVAQQGTELTVSSVVGEGSKFTFEWPFESSTRVQPTLCTLEGSVLIIEPHAALAENLGALVRRWGLECRLAHTLDAALLILCEGYEPDRVMAPLDCVKSAEARLVLAPTAARRALIVTCPAGEPLPSWMHEYRSLPRPLRPLMVHAALRGQLEADRRNAVQEVISLRAGPLESAPCLLVVDDSPANCQVLVGMLERLGLRSRAVHDGAAAIAAMKGGEPFGAVLMDVQMPIMDGYEAAAAIREWEQGAARRTPILGVSGNGGEAHQKKMRDAGMDDSLTKPVMLEMLAEKVKKWVDLANPAGEPAPQAARRSTSPADPRLLLVADDNDANRKVLVGMLRRLGYACRVVCNGAEALEAAAAERFAAILMDVEMPVMDGHAATRAIRAQRREEDPWLPIIAVTASADEAQRGRALQAGMDDVIAKPVSMDVLQEKLDMWIDPVSQGEGTAANDRASTSTADRPRTRHRLLLVADDNDANRRVISGMLERLDYRCEVVTNGKEALERVRSGRRYDAVLMDIQMPVMDGHEAARSIRSWLDGRDERIPIIAISAHSDGQQQALAMASGMDDFVAKPVSMDILVERLGRWLKPSASTPPLQTEALNLEFGTLDLAVAQDSEHLDVRQLEQLLELQSPQQPMLARRIIEGFLAELPEQRAALATAWEAKDRVALGRIAHRLKGSSMTVGGKKLNEQCSRLESWADGALGVEPPSREQLDLTLHELTTILIRLLP